MKIKSTISMVMFYLFTVLSIVLFIMIGSIDDISIGKLVEYIKLLFIFKLTVLITLALYDYRIFVRHIFATYHLVDTLIGCLRNKTSKEYMIRYRLYVELGSGFGFYKYMLSVYDNRHKNVVTVRNRLVRG